MAKKRGSGPNKSQLIRDFRTNNPDASPKDIAAALANDGVKVSPGFVSTVLSTAKRKAKGRGGPRGPRKATAGGGGAGGIADLVQAKKLVDSVGGVSQARAALDALAKILG